MAPITTTKEVDAICSGDQVVTARGEIRTVVARYRPGLRIVVAWADGTMTVYPVGATVEVIRPD